MNFANLWAGKMNLDRYDFCVLIDESGNPAFDKLADGKGHGSDFLNLGAVFIAKEECESFYEHLNYIKKVLGIDSICALISFAVIFFSTLILKEFANSSLVWYSEVFSIDDFNDINSFIDCELKIDL